MNTIYWILLINVLWGEYQKISKLITKLKVYYMQLEAKGPLMYYPVEQDIVPRQ